MVVRKDISHFSLGFEPFLPGVAHSLWIIQVSSGIETNQVIMCFRVIHIHKVHIIGSNTFHAMLFPQLEQGPVHKNLVVKYNFVQIGITGPVALHFQVEIFSENPLIFKKYFLGLFNAPVHNGLGNFSTQACREADHTFTVLLQDFPIDSGFVIKTFGPPERDQGCQVLVTHMVFGQQYDMIHTIQVLVLFGMP